MNREVWSISAISNLFFFRPAKVENIGSVKIIKIFPFRVKLRISKMDVKLLNFIRMHSLPMRKAIARACESLVAVWTFVWFLQFKENNLFISKCSNAFSGFTIPVC